MTGTLEQIMDRLKKLEQDRCCTVKEIKEIQYGVQFRLRIEEQEGMVRFYDGKKGLKMDLSQIKEEKIRNAFSAKLEEFLSFRGEEKRKEDSSVKQQIVFGLPLTIMGSDESGKGDYFGPLVTAAVFLPSLKIAEELMDLGMKDSKKLPAGKINSLAEAIMERCPYAVSVLKNEEYNRLYEKIQNLNTLLAKQHVDTISLLQEKCGEKTVLVDQFAKGPVLAEMMEKRNIEAELYQKERGEEHPAVAAASIVARYFFMREMAQMEEKYQMPFGLGAGEGMLTSAKAFAARYGKEELRQVAKLHFKTTAQL